MASWKDMIRRELVDIVEWPDDSGTALVHRFQRPANEIKNGAQLIVRPGQMAVFVDEGTIADVFMPGSYTLETGNLPVLSRLQGWKHGFNSPFKAEVYFVSTTQFAGQKWGTPNPVMLRDPEFGPVRVRAFGTYSYLVAEPAKLLVQLVGAQPRFTAANIAEQLRAQVVTQLADILGEAKIPVLDLAARYDDLARLLAERLERDFGQYGLRVTQVVIENVSLPENVNQALDTRTRMGVIGDLGRYTQYQTAEAIGKAADQPGGAAGSALGLGMGAALGVGIGQQVSGALGGAAAPPPAPAAPPPLPQEVQYFVAVDGKQTGPFPLGQLGPRVEAGEITGSTLVWTQGMSAWAPAESVADLAPWFSRTPPPL